MSRTATPTHARARAFNIDRTERKLGRGFFTSLSAELFLLRKRAAYWILLVLWTVVGTTFGYIVPYLTWRNNTDTQLATFDALLPGNLVGNVTAGFPFYGGAFVLILGVLSVGSDFGWGTFKTVLTQRPGRLSLFGAKLAALATAIVPFVVATFAIGALVSGFIANQERISGNWPPIADLALGVLASWFILAVWTAFGVMLAVLSRGTSLAIGIGILYALAIEGLLSALASQVSMLDPLVELFLRANAYSLVQTFGGITDGDGPGAFRGPFVSGEQALIVLSSYLIGFLLISAIMLRRRDVEG